MAANQGFTVKAGEWVLDLACGSGAQAKHFDKCIGPIGYLRCVDIHQPSIDLIKERVGHKYGREFVTSDMMDFSAYLKEADAFSLAHCSFSALPLRSILLLSCVKLAKIIQKPLGRLAISLPCTPHGMVEFAKSIHSIPETVEPAIELGESLCRHFQELVWRSGCELFQ